jgi:CO/xanthine dehydrogenase Mo-binding subunit
VNRRVVNASSGGAANHGYSLPTIRAATVSLPRSRPEPSERSADAEEAGLPRLAASEPSREQDTSILEWLLQVEYVQHQPAVETTFDPENFSFPHGTHLCAAEVDTETGHARIRSYVAVDDVGRVINPQIVEGQVHGGLAQGIAQALYEEAVYDDDGNLVTGTLVDYLVPSAADLPSYTTDRTETPATSNPLGVKGVGEAGTIASTPAVVNAVVDALRPSGVTDVAMPCSPYRVWQALKDGGAQS